MLKLEFIGNVGKDAETKKINDTSNVIKFSVAVNESYKNKDGEKVENTIWIECEMWNREKLGQYLKKGTMVYVEGKPDVNAYIPKDSTEAKGGLVCKVDEIQFLSKKE
jgi:single-strand DNA-binding protein